jgi:hypothetical protein
MCRRRLWACRASWTAAATSAGSVRTLRCCFPGLQHLVVTMPSEPKLQFLQVRQLRSTLCDVRCRYAGTQVQISEFAPEYVHAVRLWIVLGVDDLKLCAVYTDEPGRFRHGALLSVRKIFTLSIASPLALKGGTDLRRQSGEVRLPALGVRSSLRCSHSTPLSNLAPIRQRRYLDAGDVVPRGELGRNEDRAAARAGHMRSQVPRVFSTRARSTCSRCHQRGELLVGRQQDRLQRPLLGRCGRLPGSLTVRNWPASRQRLPQVPLQVAACRLAWCREALTDEGAHHRPAVLTRGCDPPTVVRAGQRPRAAGRRILFDANQYTEAAHCYTLAVTAVGKPTPSTYGMRPDPPCVHRRVRAPVRSSRIHAQPDQCPRPARR